MHAYSLYRNGIARFFAIFIGSLTCLLLPLTAFADVTRQLEINFSFNSAAVTDKMVSAYRLYASGNLVCEQEPPAYQEPLVCPISLPNGTYPFTLSVTFDDGSETPHSPPFQFTLHNGVNITPIINLLLLDEQ